MRALAGYPPIHAAVAAHAARVLQAYEDAKADLG
jgi:hypothetical protein